MYSQKYKRKRKIERGRGREREKERVKIKDTKRVGEEKTREKRIRSPSHMTTEQCDYCLLAALLKLPHAKGALAPTLDSLLIKQRRVNISNINVEN